uniref:Uncharacterized protein n=1 Tax=Panagrolaimus sp. ES5 TaxID=591445 RepID=A0AC34GXK5_9BILA
MKAFFLVFGLLLLCCDCPDNTSGDDCGTLVTCEPDDCGINATCTVFNHKKVCSCLPGYAGDPNTKCDIRTKRACMSGDPHYTTFDGTTFDYMGTCPYYVMTSCSNADNFSIVGTNTFTDARKIVSYISEFTLKTQGSEFRVDSGLNYYIDGIRKYYPFYWPSKDDPKIVATKPSDTVIIQDNESGAVITFAYAYLCAEVPLNDMFYGNEKMCGIWGSINDICTDDIADKNGNNFAEPVSCAVGKNLEAIHFMDFWVSDSTVNNCVEGEVVSNISSTCDPQVAQNQCDLIRQATKGIGPFGACLALGYDIVENAFHDCAFDVCNSFPLCNALDSFALLCNQLPFANIDNWRDISNCSYPCPPHSHYSMKTPKCQNSCADPNYSNSSSCHDGYEEGCTCDPNYFFDSNGENNGFGFACRALDDCGCVDGNGNYYPPHDHWLNVNCTVATQCSDGQLTSTPTACATDGDCENINGFPTCQCLPGYTGNGYTCTDIDECHDDSGLCNANIGHGICTNLPGTYNCTCFSPYSGSQCENYTPSRHCADLQIFHGISQNGTYSISIGADYFSQLTDADLNWTTVFCDMESNGGGWTLMSHGNGSSSKTFNEYAAGFGDPSSLNVWLGLDNIHAMTTSTPTSLRIIIEQCATAFFPDETDEFSVLYVTWDKDAVEDAFMYLRPANYPLYDDHHDDTTPATESYETTTSV